MTRAALLLLLLVCPAACQDVGQDSNAVLSQHADEEFYKAKAAAEVAVSNSEKVKQQADRQGQKSSETEQGVLLITSKADRTKEAVESQMVKYKEAREKADDKVKGYREARKNFVEDLKSLLEARVTNVKAKNRVTKYTSKVEIATKKAQHAAKQRDNAKMYDGYAKRALKRSYDFSDQAANQFREAQQQVREAQKTGAQEAIVMAAKVTAKAKLVADTSKLWLAKVQARRDATMQQKAKADKEYRKALNAKQKAKRKLQVAIQSADMSSASLEAAEDTASTGRNALQGMKDGAIEALEQVMEQAKVTVKRQKKAVQLAEQAVSEVRRSKEKAAKRKELAKKVRRAAKVRLNLAQHALDAAQFAAAIKAKLIKILSRKLNRAKRRLRSFQAEYKRRKAVRDLRAHKEEEDRMHVLKQSMDMKHLDLSARLKDARAKKTIATRRAKEAMARARIAAKAAALAAGAKDKIAVINKKAEQASELNKAQIGEAEATLANVPPAFYHHWAAEQNARRKAQAVSEDGTPKEAGLSANEKAIAAESLAAAQKAAKDAIDANGAR